MFRTLLKSKIHRVAVTQCELHYEGSCAIDEDLLDAANIAENEQVHIWNVTRGTRLVTYALRGDRNSGIICINGAAAHLAEPGDKVIIATFAEVEAHEAKAWEPTVVMVDEKNVMRDAAYRELAGPKRRMAS